MFGGNQKSPALKVTRKGPFTFLRRIISTKLNVNVNTSGFLLWTTLIINQVTEKSRGGSRVTDEYNTTLTFGEMVAIYHDIWNTMLIGSLSALSWICPHSFSVSFFYVSGFFCNSLQHDESCADRVIQKEEKMMQPRKLRMTWIVKGKLCLRKVVADWEVSGK